MNDIAKAAFIASQAACLQADIAAMQCQNSLDLKADRPITHPPHEFEALINKYGLGHNDVIVYLTQ